jgi:Ca2+-binding RTX toxin-like protein
MYVPFARRRTAIGAVAGLSIAAALGLTGQARADYSVKASSGTLQIVGDSASDKLAILPSQTQLVLDVGADGTSDLILDRSTFTAVSVNAGGGDDEVRVFNSVDPPAMTIDGGSGNDTLIGANGDDTLIGGIGDDFADGNIGADTVQLGAGNDRFQWDPGDGSDSVDAQTGTDVLDFNGSNASERIALAANGSHVQLTRDIASITMDLAGFERANVRALGGTDAVDIDQLAGTGLAAAHVDLAGFDGNDDAGADTVTLHGSDGDDRAAIGSGTEATISGAGPDVSVAGIGSGDHATFDGGTGTDTATYTGTAGADQVGIARNGDSVATFAEGGAPVDTNVEELVVQGLGGNDVLTAQNGIGALTHLTLDGGAGDDDLRGGDGADTLIGGIGDDHVDGNIGADTAQLGAGNDHFQWDPGDGSDTVEGQTGSDVLDFNGSNAGETIDVSANGPRVRLYRDIASITTDFAGIEALSLRALGSADTITVNDLTGTELKTADIDLSGFDGQGDGAADTVIVNGTANRDRVKVTRSGSQVLTAGLPALTRIAGSEPTLDRLAINTLGGDDDVAVAPDVSDLIAPVVDLGDGE